MIVSRTPLRVSFCGGGSDLEEYYSKSKDGGCVTSVALKKHIYVTVNSRFDDSVRVSYSEMEIVDDFENLKHQLVKEAMRITGVTKGVEIIRECSLNGTPGGSDTRQYWSTIVITLPDSLIILLPAWSWIVSTFNILLIIFPIC